MEGDVSDGIGWLDVHPENGILNEGGDKREGEQESERLSEGEYICIH